MLKAVRWLIAKNPLYRDMSVNQTWVESCEQVDNEMWARVCDDPQRSLTPEDTGDIEPSSTRSTDVETEDSDGDDDDLTQKVRGLKYSTCLQPCNPEYAASELSMAPAEGQTPLDIMMDVNAELLAFPSKFPVGRGGMTDDRQVKLTPRKYFVQRLVNKDKRFASDVNYLFFGQFVTEQKQIRDNISVAMRQTAGRVSARDVSDTEHVRQLIQRNNAYNFLQNVRGSLA